MLEHSLDDYPITTAILAYSTRTVFRLERCIESGHFYATVTEEPNKENVRRRGEGFWYCVPTVTSNKLRIWIKSISNLDSRGT